MRVNDARQGFQVDPDRPLPAEWIVFRLLSRMKWSWDDYRNTPAALVDWFLAFIELESGDGDGG